MDPSSIDALGAETLRMGIQFLYAQAGEALKRWRERGEGESDEEALPTVAEAREALAREPEALTVDFAVLDRLGSQIKELRTALGEYAEGIQKIDPEDPRLVETTAGLRLALEAVLGQDLTFEGEVRTAGDSEIGAKVSVDEVAGYVAGVLADERVDGRIRVDIDAGRVLPGGRVVGVDLTGGEEPDPG